MYYNKENTIKCILFFISTCLRRLYFVPKFMKIILTFYIVARLLSVKKKDHKKHNDCFNFFVSIVTRKQYYLFIRLVRKLIIFPLHRIAWCRWKNKQPINVALNHNERITQCTVMVTNDVISKNSLSFGRLFLRYCQTTSVRNFLTGDRKLPNNSPFSLRFVSSYKTIINGKKGDRQTNRLTKLRL